MHADSFDLSRVWTITSALTVRGNDVKRSALHFSVIPCTKNGNWTSNHDRRRLQLLLDKPRRCIRLFLLAIILPMLACFARRCNLFSFSVFSLSFFLLPSSTTMNADLGLPVHCFRHLPLHDTNASMISFSSAHLLLDAQNPALVIY